MDYHCPNPHFHRRHHLRGLSPICPPLCREGDIRYRIRRWLGRQSSTWFLLFPSLQLRLSGCYELGCQFLRINLGLSSVVEREDFVHFRILFPQPVVYIIGFKVVAFKPRISTFFVNVCFMGRVEFLGVL